MVNRDRLIQDALDYIEANLRGDLLLEDISDAANYSPWHFHRLFTAYTGMGVGEYIRRRRLSEASRQLTDSDVQIVRLAEAWGFESQAAFTRAFTRQFGISPAKHRRQRQNLPCQSPITFKLRKKGVHMINARITHKPAFTIIGIRCQTTMQNNVIPQLWDDFGKVCDKIPAPKYPETALGICYGEADKEMTPETPFYYLAGMEVDASAKVPEGMLSLDMPEKEYAVFEHHGALDDLHDTYGAIYDDWFGKSEYRPSGEYDFELYDERFQYGKPESVMEIWVPIVKK